MDTDKQPTVADDLFGVNPNERYQGDDLTAIDLFESTYDLFDVIADKLGVRLHDGAEAWRDLARAIIDKTKILEQKQKPCSNAHGHRCLSCGEKF